MDWTDCPLIERVPGKLGGAPVIRHSRVRPDDLLVNRGEGEEWLADAYRLPLDIVRQVLAFRHSCPYDNCMDISFDPAKRAATLQKRGLDFADAAEAFMGVSGTIEDRRFDYGEVRFITAGFLAGRFVIVVWTPRGNSRHIISMRLGHAKERRRWQL